MKRLLLCILGVSFWGLNGMASPNDNDTLQKIAYKWYGVEYADYPYRPGFQGPEYTALTYELIGDTIISEFKFHKFYLTTRDGRILSYQGAVRYSHIESGLQMYYIPADYEPKDDVFGGFLLQKFDVEVGDTVQAYNGLNELCGEYLTSSYIVTDIQYLDARKHVRVKKNSYYGEKVELEWIEGIGTPHIIWSGERLCQPTDGSTVIPYTLCAADSEGNILYSFDTDYLGIHNNNCQWEPMAIENVSTDKSSASKLLRDGNMFIKIDDKTYTLTGQEVK